MKFSIRDLFLLTVIVALVLGWGLDHWRVTKRNRQVEDALRVVDWQVTEDGVLDRWSLPHSIRDFSDEERKEFGRIPKTDFVPTPLPNSQAPAPNPPKP